MSTGPTGAGINGYTMNTVLIVALIFGIIQTIFYWDESQDIDRSSKIVLKPEWMQYSSIVFCVIMLVCLIVVNKGNPKAGSIIFRFFLAGYMFLMIVNSIDKISNREHNSETCEIFIPKSKHYNNWLYGFFRYLIVSFIVFMSIYLCMDSTTKVGVKTPTSIFTPITWSILAPTVIIGGLHLMMMLLSGNIEGGKTIDPQKLFLQYVKGTGSYSSDGWLADDIVRTVLRIIFFIFVIYQILRIYGNTVLKNANIDIATYLNPDNIMVFMVFIVIGIPLIIKYMMSHKCVLKQASEDSGEKDTDIECILDKYGGLNIYFIIPFVPLFILSFGKDVNLGISLFLVLLVVSGAIAPTAYHLAKSA